MNQLADKDSVEKILQDMERGVKKEDQKSTPSANSDSLEAQMNQARESKVSEFKLQVDFDKLPEDAANSAPQEAAPDISNEQEVSDSQNETLKAEEAEVDNFAISSDTALEATGKHKKRKVKSDDSAAKQSWMFLRGIIYVCAILIVSGCLTYFIIAAMLDITAIKKSNLKIDVEIPTGAGTKQIAEILEDNELIDHPFIFRMYSKLKNYDGKFQPGLFTLSADMGYDSLMSEIATAKERETVRVVIPEGYTIDKIAKKLEAEEVCKASEFYTVLVEGEFDFDFLDQVPQVTDKGYEGRVYRLEGYLFPDTYDFYKNSSAESVIKKMLSTFNTKLDMNLRAAIKSAGMTLDEAVILASIVQGEAADTDNMPKVSRVLHNRLDNPQIFPKLQCDSTGAYITNLMAPIVGNVEVTNVAYNTYTREGLPVGPINNPSLQALKAAIIPTDKKEFKEYFYFANDKNRNTYYSKTLSQHEAVCRKYGIGMYGK